MKIVRITAVVPVKAHETHVEAILKELGSYTSKEPGFIVDYEFHAQGKPPLPPSFMG